MSGQLKAIWTKTEWGGPMTSRESADLVAGRGIIGNINQGGRRQVTIIEEETWAEVMRELGSDLPPETRRANLLVGGIRLMETRGKILKIGSVCRLLIRGETKPCIAMDEKLPGLKNALKPNWNGGVFGEILDDGRISVGDPVGWEAVLE
ncbi:MAG: MOSC domain-containing protein [Pyrinomonadaceae bacterium]